MNAPNYSVEAGSSLLEIALSLLLISLAVGAMKTLEYKSFQSFKEGKNRTQRNERKLLEPKHCHLRAANELTILTCKGSASAETFHFVGTTP